MKGDGTGTIRNGNKKAECRAYIEKRNELIVLAVKIANEKHGKSRKRIGGQNYVDEWNRTYHKAMNRLAYEAGLVVFR